MNKNVIYFLLVLLMFFKSHAESDFKGLFFINTYAPKMDFSPKDWKQDAAQIWLTSSAEINETISSDFTLDMLAQGNSINPNRKDFEMYLREGYFEKKLPSWRIKFGRIFLPWGNADGFNPTNILGAWDQTRMSTDDETKRVASDSLVFEYLPERRTVKCVDWVNVKTRSGRRKKCKEKEVSVLKKNWKLTLVWTPVFPKSKSVLLSNNLGPFTIQNNTNETSKLSDAESAIKWRYEGEGWDLSLMAFNGFQHDPHYSLVGPTTLQPSYLRQNVFGSEFSTTYSDYIITFESAYKKTDNIDGKDRTLDPSHMESIMGFERGFYDKFRFKLQVFSKEYSDWKYDQTTSNPTTEYLTQLNSKLFGYHVKSQSGVSGFINYEDEDRGFKVEIFAQNNTSTKEGLGQITVSKKWTDVFETSIGTIDIYGDAGSPSYESRGLSNYFAELKVWF